MALLGVEIGEGKPKKKSALENAASVLGILQSVGGLVSGGYDALVNKPAEIGAAETKNLLMEKELNRQAINLKEMAGKTSGGTSQIGALTNTTPGTIKETMKPWKASKQFMPDSRLKPVQ